MLTTAAAMLPHAARAPRPLAPACSCSRALPALRARQPRLVRCLAAWQQVTDASTGKSYYWNTETNETAWELPPSSPSQGAVAATAAAAAAAASSSEEATVTASNVGRGSFGAGAAAEEAPSGKRGPEELLALLVEVLATEASGGMDFWEVARSLRSEGVFEEEFLFGFLDARIAGASGDDAERQTLKSVQAKLSNPLLRQPAPFEF